MSEPQIQSEGNRRIASISSEGWPDDPLALAAQISDRLAATAPDVAVAAPIQVLVDFPPSSADESPAAWRCQVGVPVVGLPRSGEGIMIEDYAGLQVLEAPHRGPVATLAATYHALADQARAMGWRLRPYWRVAIRCQPAADGNPVPSTDVGVFLDR